MTVGLAGDGLGADEEAIVRDELAGGCAIHLDLAGGIDGAIPVIRAAAADSGGIGPTGWSLR